MIAATRSSGSVSESVLYVAFELGHRQWKLAMTSGFGVAPLLKTVPSGDFAAVARALAQARVQSGLDAAAPVVSCYEAGRDGFWIHRALVARGIQNRVVDSASIEVNRRARRLKTDRIDAIKLVMMLVRRCLGDTCVWHEVRVPTADDEAARHRTRERQTLVAERTRLLNQMRSWLATLGTALPTRRAAGWWTQVTDWAGDPLPAAVQDRLARADTRFALLEAQIATLDAEQAAAIAASPADSPARRLVQLKGVGTTSAAILLEEGLVWRAFHNRRELGGVLGFAPLAYASGDTRHEQGISRAGNDRLQSTMVQLAWSWLKWQPTSPLSAWYRHRFAQGARARKVGIVALARRLLIALWRWATQGIQPAGTALKAA